ncbi:hypothetical protein [Hymenobacter cellulosilyticus]|uniref:DUF3347 domain-containing protein n=1 Tax=Hymenobacter cellulosilyticus TaxID=2932248 RepID=A0A8T9Q998_9BACT|nr:hypothetical protein [Hymenobacter cellulosilyticus]UOQ72971.1 hypothetical protein MUN79_03015 [Hymenobacter cellulosilyticus]
MQKLIVTLILFVSLCTVGQRAQAQTTALSDSLTEKKIIQTVGADMCRQLTAENAKQPLENLTAQEAQQLFVRLIMSSASTSPELVTALTSNPAGANKYGEILGKKIGLWLLKECPITQPLFMKMGAQEISKKQPIPAAEAKILQPMAVEVCHDLEARQKKQDLNALTPEKRSEVLQEVVQKSMKAHAKELTQQYGADIFLDSERMRAVGTKLGLQMGTQCPNILMMLANVK